MSFDDVIRAGGIVLFPSDTVYGLAVHPDHAGRLYALKGRPESKPSALMYFDLETALAAHPDLGPRTRTALGRLVPGPATVVLPGGVGVRVIDLPGASVPVLQSSANRSGEPEARRLVDVDPVIRAGVDLEIDGGKLPGIPSTVVDLRDYEGEGHWQILRDGALPLEAVSAALDGDDHFDPDAYAAMIRDEIPGYEQLQTEIVAATGHGAERILDLGTGTGETAARVLAAHPTATLVGVDASASMLAAALGRVPSADLRVARLQDPLPDGPFDLVVSALAIHHLTAVEKADLFKRIAAITNRFVLGDVIEGTSIPLTSGYDKPSPLADQLRWLTEAGFTQVAVRWETADLAVVLAERSG